MPAARRKKKRRARLSQWQVERMVHLYSVKGLSMDAIGSLYGGRSEKDIRQILWRAGVKVNKGGRGPGLRIPDETVAAIYADYTAGISLNKVAAKHGRSRRALTQLFQRRGLALREYSGNTARAEGGTFKPLVPHTEAEIQALIDEATDIAIPDALRIEWKKWPLDRRLDFVTRLRARLGPPLPDPALFSSNVEFFAYGHPRAHALMDKINEGTDSRTFRVKINLKTWGVIYDDLLWTWSVNSGGFIQGPFHPEHGRPPLHRVLFKLHHGEIPPGGVIRFADGNRFNLDPSNLVLATRDDLARENQAAALRRKSRDLTAILFNRSQSDTPHDDTFQRLHRAKR